MDLGTNRVTLGKSVLLAEKPLVLCSLPPIPPSPLEDIPSAAPIISNGFTLIRSQRVPHFEGIAELYEHIATGAQVLFMRNPDQHRHLQIALYTPARDSSGRQHSFEHLVFRGSEGYQVSQPFIELAKGSLLSGNNAWTARDHTVYWSSSTLEEDLEHHADITFDGVFRPLLTQRAREQEVVSLRLTEEFEFKPDPAIPPEERFRLEGRIHSEMGADHGDPELMAQEYAIRALFRETSYEHYPFGDPATLHELTEADLQELRREFYHPSNTRSIIYGDNNQGAWLSRLNSLFTGYQKQVLQFEIPARPQFLERCAVEQYYPADESQNRIRDTVVTLTWCLTDKLDPYRNLQLSILSDLLYEGEHAPLFRALTQSNMGERCSDGGLDSSLAYHLFSVGLSGMDHARVDDLENLIFATLNDIYQKGFSEDLIHSRLEKFELESRMSQTEADRGQLYATSALESWIHGGDPFDALITPELFNRLSVDLQTNPRLFQDLLQDQLIQNKSFVRVTMLPDRALLREWEDGEQKVIKKMLGNSDPLEIEANMRTAMATKYVDDPTQLARIPRLELSVLPRNSPTLPKRECIAEPRLSLYELNTHGVVHLNLVISLSHIDPPVIPYVTALAQLLGAMPTNHLSTNDLQMQVQRKTAGLKITVENHAIVGRDDWNSLLVISGEALAKNGLDLAKLISTVLSESRFDDSEQVLQVLKAARAEVEGTLEFHATDIAFTRLSAQLTPEGYRQDQFEGMEFLKFMRSLNAGIRSADDWPRILRRLNEARDAILAATDAALIVTADSDSLETFLKDGGHQELLSPFGNSGVNSSVLSEEMPPSRRTEGFKIPSAINYVAQAFDLKKQGFQHHGSMHVINQHLSQETMWEHLADRGGAYGASSHWDPERGILYLGSSRDPNIASTAQIADHIIADLRSREFTRGELRRSIVRAIGELDAPQRPEERTWDDFVAMKQCWTRERRQEERDQIFETKIGNVRDFVEALEAAKKDAHTFVLGSKRNLTRFANTPEGAGIEIQ